jgi:hypothetical protein
MDTSSALHQHALRVTPPVTMMRRGVGVGVGVTEKIICNFGLHFV